jgi:hypothetical protein
MARIRSYLRRDGRGHWTAVTGHKRRPYFALFRCSIDGFGTPDRMVAVAPFTARGAQLLDLETERRATRRGESYGYVEERHLTPSELPKRRLR